MRRRIRQADPVMFAALAILVGVGIAISYSTTVDTPREPLFSRHLVSVLAGVVAFVLFSAIPYRVFKQLSVFVYPASVITLLLVLILGFEGLGARRWLRLGPVAFQPSEVAKVTTLLAVAHFLSGRHINARRPDVILRALALVLLPAALILRQPDLGTALAFLGLLLAVLFWAGTPFSSILFVGSLAVTGLITFRLPPVIGGGRVSGGVEDLVALQLAAVWALFLIIIFVVQRIRRVRRRVLLATLLAHLAVGFAAPLAWHGIEEYQRVRVLTFLNPGREPTGAGYQVIQSKIAIGSGEFAGKGYLKGTQKALAYLPQQHTDFVFSVVGEETGFAGSFIVVGLFLLLLTRGVRAAHLARDRFAGLLAAGAVGILAYHIFVNLYMTMGFAPVTGLPLPFISYGGSFLVVAMALAGILQNVVMRRHGY